MNEFDDYVVVYINGKAYYLYYETDLLCPIWYEYC